MNDWVLDLLIKPNLSKSDADKIAKRLAEAVKTELSAQNLGNIKVDEKQLTKASKDVLKSLNTVVRELSTNLQSFTKIVKQAQVEAGKAATATTRAVKPAAGYDPGYPARRPLRESAKSTVSARSAGAPSGAATRSGVETTKRELERKASKEAKNLSAAFSLLLDSPEEAIKTIQAETAAARSKFASKAKKSVRTFTENIERILETLTTARFDPNIVANLRQYRAPSRNLSERFRQESRGFKLPGREELDRVFSEQRYPGVSKPGSGVDELKSAIRALAGVARKPGDAPSESIFAALSEVKKLTQKGGLGVSSKVGKDIQVKSADIVKDILRKIIVRLNAEARKAGRAIEKAAAEGADEKQLRRLGTAYESSMDRLVQALRVINSSADRFNINLVENARGRTGRPPGRKEEAQFLQAGVSSEVQKELKLDKTAAQAFQIAKSFKDIPDPVIRTQEVFKAIWNSARGNSADLSKTIARVSETLRHTHVSGLVNRKEVEELIGLLDKYRKQIESFKLQSAGLGAGRATHPTIPRAFDLAEEGGTTKAYLQRVRDLQSKIASDESIKKGVRVPITIPVETAHGVRNITVEFRKMGSTIDKVIPKATEMKRALSFRDSITSAFRRVALWGTAAGITYGAVNAFREAGRTMMDVETGVTNLSKVVRSADKDLEAFSESAISSAKRIATEYGTSIQEAFKSMRIFAQQGLEMADIIKLTESTSIAANTTVLDQAKAAEGLTSAIKQFGLEASSSMAIVDAWNEVAKRNAVTELTLVDALKKAGSAARTVGVDFNQLIGLTTAIGEATRQPGREVGTSLRFIFQRTLRPETERTLAKMGVATKDLEGNFRGFMEVLTELSGRWDDFSRGQQLAIAQALGGARQYNAVVALMNNYATAIKASEDALNSQGSAQLENIKVMGTTTKIFAQAKASMDSLSVSMGKVFLPIAKTVADVMRSVLDVFASMPASLHLIVGGLAAATVGLSRFAYQADLILASGAGGLGGAAQGGGAIAGGLAAGLVGRGRQVDTLTEGPKLGGEIGIAAVGLADFAKGGGRELTKLSGTIVDVNGRAVKGAENFTKMQLAIRGMGVQAADSAAVTAIGMRHMNSPISKVTLATARLGKGFANAAISITSKVAEVVASLAGFSTASILASKNARLATVANWGLARSFGALAVAGVAVYGIIKLTSALYDYATAKRKSGGEVQKDLRAELAQRQEVLRNLQRQRSILDSLETQRKSIAKAEEKELSGGDPGLNAGSASLRRYNFELKKVQAGRDIAQIDPTNVDKFDEFGNVILKAASSFEKMGDASIKAQAHLVALTRLKIAKAFAKDVADAAKDLRRLEDRIRNVHRIATAEKFGFGGATGATSEKYKKQASEVFSQTAKVDKIVSNMISQIKALPKETSLFSLQEFAKSKEIMDALLISIRENNSALQQMGRPAATASDKLNQLALTIKGFRGVGLKVFETKGLYEQQKVAVTSLEDIITAFEKTGKRLKGKELVLIEGDNPFGLTQASTALNQAGELIVEGFDKTGNKVEVAFTEFVRRINDKSQVSIIDPTILTRKLSQNIIKVQRKIAGAGAGLLDIPGNLDLGVNFDFQLGDVDRLQKVGRAASESIVAAYQAQREYNSSLEDFKKRSKDDPTAQLSAERAKSLNISRAIVSALNHMIKFESVLERLGNAFAKTTHELQKSAIADRVESQFGSVYGTISGYSEKLTVNLPKTLEELTPDQRLARSNPELVSGIRASQRTLDSLKSQIVAMEQLSGGDIQKMFESFTNQDQKIFTSALDTLGGDLKGSIIVTHLGALERINEKGFSKLYKALTGQPDKKDVNKTTSEQIKAGERTVDSLAKSFAQYVSTSSLLRSGAYRRNDAGTGLIRRSNRAFNQRERERLRQLRAQSLDVFGLGPKSKGERPVGPGSVVEAEKQRKIQLEAARKSSKGFAETVKEELRAILAGQRTGIPELDVETLALRLSLRLNKEGARLVNLGGGPGTNFISADAPDAALIGAGKVLQDFANKLATIGAGDLSRKDLKELADVLKALLKSSVKQATNTTSGLGTPAAPAGRSSLAFVSALRKSAVEEVSEGLSKALKITRLSAKELQKSLLGLSQALGFVGTRVESFLFSVSTGVDQIKKNLELGRLTRGVTAPIAGSLRGVSVPKIELGKLKGELSPVERVAKTFGDYFGNISEQETARVEAVGLFSKLSGELLKVRKDITGLLTGGEKLANREALVRLQGKTEQLYGNMARELVNVNNRMTPFIESLTKMVRLEAAKKNIEGIINALRKAEELQFDTKSIDIALGRHPLSRVTPQFGEPAGLDKFQQQLFQLQQKQRAGAISGQDFTYEKKKIEFQKEEALIQYQQTKENSKLRSEIEAARRAMGILWDAQSQGIGGVGGLIQTLKTDLEGAGQATRTRSGVYEFQGVPSLFGIDKELAKVQEAIKEKGFRQQRDVVMAPLEGLQTEANKLLSQVKDEISVQTKALAKLGPAGEGKDLAAQAVSFFKDTGDRVSSVLGTSVNKIAESVVRASALLSSGTDEHVPKLLSNIDHAAGGFKNIGDSVIRVAQQIRGAATGVVSGKPLSGSKGTALATPKASGGVISGPGGVDNVPAMLTAGEFVIPKNVVDKYGVSYFNSLISGGVRGFQSGGVVGTGTTAGTRLAAIWKGIIDDMNSQIQILSTVKTTKIPLALAEANDPEKMPAHIAAAYAKSRKQPDISADELDFNEAYARSLGQPLEGLGKTVTKVRDSFIVLDGAVTTVKDSTREIKNYTERRRPGSGDYAPYSGPGSGDYATGGKVQFLGGKVGPGFDAISKINDLVIALAGLEAKVSDPKLSISQGPAILKQFQQTRSAAASLFRGDIRTGGLPLPQAFQTERQKAAGGASLTERQRAGLPEEYKALILALNKTTKAIGGIGTGDLSKLRPNDPAKIGAKKGGRAAPSGGIKISSDSMAELFDTVSAAVKDGMEDVKVGFSKESLLEMEESIRRGAASISDAIAQAAPTLKGAGGAGSLGSAVKSELDQLNGRVDSLSEKITLENDALQSRLNERFNDVEVQIMSEIKKIYDSKFVQADTKTESVLAYVRRVESLTHSINSRIGDR